MTDYENYHDAGLIVFPLHPIVNGTCGCSNPKCTDGGKHPAISGYTGLQYMSDGDFERMAEATPLANGYGVLMSRRKEPELKNLVIDVDERNGGVESYEKLIESIPEAANSKFIVETGSSKSSKHMYFTVPVNADLRLNHAAYPGIDFKSSGYVVGSGSDHLSGKKYRVLFGSPADIDAAPVALLNVLRQERIKEDGSAPQASGATAEQLRKLIEVLPNEKVDYDNIFLMAGMALHFEMKGHPESLALWKQFSRKNTEHDEDWMFKKWRSFKLDKPNPIRIGSLRRYARQMGIDWHSIFPHLDITGEVIQASKTAERIATKGAETLKEQLGLTESADELIKALGIDPVVIDRFISETVRNSTNSGELLILTKAEHLNNHRKNESWPYLLRTYGAPYNSKAVEKLILDKLATCGEDGKEPSKAAIDKLLKDLGNPVFTPIMQHIEYHNQRGAVSFQVDMFAHERSVRLRDRDAAYTLTHRPLVSSDHNPLAQYDAAIVADYKDHFPELDEVLDFLSMARFAPDRKKAYLWLHCPSDWGKGFFKSALKIIGATAELNVKEVEAFFEGKPVGRDPHEFTRTLCLVFDEFKSVKSELKQIENTITVTPKFKMASEVEVFAKLFLSAETVGSLIGESGIEDQMANRFSCILGTGNLEVRPMFVEVGKHEYMRHIVCYMLEQLNTTIEQGRNLGRAEAAKQADRALSAFHQKHGIDKLAPRLSEALEGIANEFLSDIYAEHKQIDNGMGLLRGLYTNSSQLYRNAAGDLCLRQANKTIGDWLKNTRDHSELRTLSFKRAEILKLISKDGSGKAITVRNPARHGETGKAVVLKSLPTDYAAHRDGEDEHEFDI